MIQKIKKIITDERIPSVEQYEYEEFLNPSKLYYPITTNRASKGELFIKKGD